MDAKKKHILVAQEKVYDQDLIYALIIRLLVSSRDINFDDILSCEFAAYPPSMFSADGHMITARSKLVMKKNLQVTISERNCPNPETVIYDVSALLWDLEWPCEKAKLNTYINT